MMKKVDEKGSLRGSRKTILKRLIIAVEIFVMLFELSVTNGFAPIYAQAVENAAIESSAAETEKETQEENNSEPAQEENKQESASEGSGSQQQAESGSEGSSTAAEGSASEPENPENQSSVGSSQEEAAEGKSSAEETASEGKSTTGASLEEKEKTEEEKAKEAAEKEKAEKEAKEKEEKEKAEKEAKEKEEKEKAEKEAKEKEEKKESEITEGELYSEAEGVKLSFGKDAEIPEGAEVATGDIGDYDGYVYSALEAAGISSDEVAGFKVMDISIVKDGEKIEPKGSVSVEISAAELFGEGALYADDEVRTVHIRHEEDEDGGHDEFDVLETSVNSADDGDESDAVTRKADSISFEAGSFSAFIFMQVRSEKTASVSGGGYEVTAVYDNMSGIPAGTEFSVSETSQDSYYDECAALFDQETYNIESIRAFDMSFKDTESEDTYQPDKDIALSIELTDEGFLEGAEVKIIRFDGSAEVVDAGIEGQSISFNAATMSVYCVVQLSVNKTLEASDGRTYAVTVKYDSVSGIPEGAVLSVSEITGGDEYDKYVEKSAKQLEEDPGTVKVARAFDISFINPETGQEYQPTRGIQVSIQLLDENLDDYESLDVVHIHGDNEQQADVVDSTVSSDSVEFEADAFSVFVVVSTTLRQILTASDGNNYLVTVRYGNNAGIPSAVELYVSEIFKGTAGYEDYLKKSAGALGATSEELAFARAFDITLKNTKTGEEYQPNKNVKVSIELLNDDLENHGDINVVHIPDEGEAQVMDSTVNGETIDFETDGFSVFVVSGLYTCTYIFYEPSSSAVPDWTETTTGYTVSNYQSKYNEIIVGKTEDNVNVSRQIVKSGDTPVIPQLSDRDGKVFGGWYKGTKSEADVILEKTAYGFGDVTITEDGQEILLFPKYTTYASVIFHDQYNSTLGGYPIMCTRRGELKAGSASIQISDVEATYSGSSNLAFYGWSETPIQNLGDGTQSDKVTTGSISVTGEKHLYPIFKKVYWLSYVTAPTGSGATYVPEKAYFDFDRTDWETKLVVPTWTGHTFLGWYEGSATGPQITDSNGNFVENISQWVNLGKEDGKLHVKANETLYAKWSDTVTASYKIVIWKEKTTSDATGTGGEKRYDFVKAVSKTANDGATVSVDDTYKGYAGTAGFEGYAFDRCDNPAIVRVDQPEVVLNVYYKLNGHTTSTGTHTLTFTDSVTGSGASTGLPQVHSVSQNTPILTGNTSGTSFVPSDPTSGRTGFSFSGWYADPGCTTRVFFDDNSSYASYEGTKVLYKNMPDYDLTIYAGWTAEWYLVQIDPNYGALNGDGSTWTWKTVESDLIQEYTHVKRDYVESSSGTYYYTKHDRAYYGYSGNEWDNGETDRDVYYSTNPNNATEDTTFEHAAGVYSYAGWYEVKADGTEVPYDFSQHVDHDTYIKLHWKKAGLYYVFYDKKAGELSGSQDNTAYADQASVLISCGATAPAGYNFVGWKVRGDANNTIYRVGENFTLDAKYEITHEGKKTIYLDAVYDKAGTASVIYDANGGTITGDVSTVDFGSIVLDPGETAQSLPTPNKSLTATKATISNLVNNKKFTLSNGNAFTRAGMTLAGWSAKQEHKASDTLYDLGGVYGVDTALPSTLYATWKVKVTYHLNSATADFGGTWDSERFTYDSTAKTYSEWVFLKDSVSMPEITPTDSEGGKLFTYWMTSSTGNSAYDFRTPVTGALDLYACWTNGIDVTVHAVDASTASLTDETSNWSTTDITVNSTTVAVDDTTCSSFVTPPAGQNYTFAFASPAPNGSLSAISEDKAIKNLFYNVSEKQVYVTYKDDSTAPLGTDHIYFVYYKKKALDIGYMSMADDANRTLTSLTSSHTSSTGNIGTYDVKANITPIAWKNDFTPALANAYTHYSFAIGGSTASEAGDLYYISKASDADDSIDLQIKKTWQGFKYSTDGSSWVKCGYDPKLYVIYYTGEPTVVTIKEQTIGSGSTAFNYDVKVNGSDYQNFSLPSNGNDSKSVVVFGTGKTITVTQTANTNYFTYVEADKGTVTASERKWTNTGATGNTATVSYTNAANIDVHVARIDISNHKIVIDDSLRSTTLADHTAPAGTIESGSLKPTTFLTSLSSTTIFTGDTSVYALGAVMYGTDDGTDVTPKSFDVASISMEKGNGDFYDLVLKDKQGNSLDRLNGYKVYYLYYPMPQIKYMKLDSDGDTLSDITGTASGNDISYNGSAVTVNGKTVTQNQRFEISLTGFKITQAVGSNTFRMPPILDDGQYVRYLSYCKLGVSDSSAVTSLNTLSNDNRITDDLTMHLKVIDNALKWSFDEETWNSFNSTPVIYAIYEERGYDLQITKAVTPNNLGDDPTFTVTLRSLAITKNQYSIEGYVSDYISAIPASGTTKGTISFSVKDGSEIKIKALGKGDYTITESGSDNYELSAKSGPISGSVTAIDLTTQDLVLDKELRLELTNKAKEICKIVTSSGEQKFYTLQSAVEYAHANAYSTIQMLTNYTMPSSDNPVIQNGDNITITAADSSGYTIKRAATNTSGPMITNHGSLTLDNLKLDGNNVSADSAMIVSDNTALALTIKGGSLVTNGKNTSGNGGAISATSGSVTITASTLSGNSAVNGGAIYSSGSSVSITGTLSGNSASNNGGALYYAGNGAISVSGSLTGNSAKNGGAIYAERGTITVSGGSMSGNNAALGNGGAIYTDAGAVNVSGGTIGGTTANSALYGSAVYVNTGSADFSGGSVTGNTATSGGAVGVGSASAKLYFSGDVTITGNTRGAEACNVYLDMDTHEVINSRDLAVTANIGIFVPDKDLIVDGRSANLYDRRGVPGAEFGTYSNNTGIAAFKNDRLTGIAVTENVDTRRLVWGKAVELQIRYLKEYNSAANFPQKAGGSWNGSKDYPTGDGNDWDDYYIPSGSSGVSEIGDDIRSKYPSLFKNKTRIFAYAFLDDGSSDIGFDQFLTEVTWNNTSGWQFTKRDGTTVSESTLSGDTKLVVYFSEPAYINIENNSAFTLTITDLILPTKINGFTGYPVVNTTTQVGYGYVYAVNGTVQSTLRTVQATDLTLAKRKSIKLMFPGGVNKSYTISGGFAVGGDTSTAISVEQTGQTISPLQYVSAGNDSRTAFSFVNGKTVNKSGDTANIIFGGKKPICKIVTNPASITYVTGVVDTVAGTGTTTYTFATLKEAVAFIENNGLTTATIEMLVDYLIPASDDVTIGSGYNVTFKTAIGDTTDGLNYSSNTSARATISRDSSKTTSFIVVTDGQNSTSLTIQGLIFDGKNYTGNINGGVVKTMDCEVSLDNCDFKNCIANNGGGIYIEFSPTSAGGTLTVKNSKFTNCQSTGSQRQGGGAIWTTAKTMILLETEFEECTGQDQGGAVFHRIDAQNSNYTEMAYSRTSASIISGCKFDSCSARSGGAIESDAINVYFGVLDDAVAAQYGITKPSDGACRFINCHSIRIPSKGYGSGGAICTYIYEKDSYVSWGSEYASKLTVKGCVFNNCTTVGDDEKKNGSGGAIRSHSVDNIIENSSFDHCEASINGGAICVNNKESKTLEVKDCTITSCIAKNGGGIYFDGQSESTALLTIFGSSSDKNNYSSYITGNTASNRGGGVYTNSSVTLINTQITGNKLTVATVDNAAGMYIIGKSNNSPKNRTLTLGETGAVTPDVTVIRDNTASGAAASNLHLMSGRDPGSVVVNCDLAERRGIGVTNPGVASQQFGTSPNSSDTWTPSYFASPSGTTDYPSFVADDGSVYGIIDRLDLTKTKIIWGGPPVCKITDASGNLLYLDSAQKNPAIFDALDVPVASGSNVDGTAVSALALLREPNPSTRHILYNADGSPYPGDGGAYTYYVKMLVETYQTSCMLNTSNKNNDATSRARTIVLTTASSDDAQFPYRGTTGTTCTIIRSGNYNNSLLKVGCNVTLTNITLDGGSELGLSSTADGGLIIIADVGGTVCELGENATLQNSYSAGNGGAVDVAWSDFRLNGGTIKNCYSALNGGAIYMTSSTKTDPARGYLKLDSGTITGCTANNGGGVFVNNGTVSLGTSLSSAKILNCTASQDGGGIYLNPGDKKPFTFVSGAISGCTANIGSGGGIFIADGITFNMSGGDISGNTARTQGGGIALGGDTAVITFSGKPWISGNTCDSSVAANKECNLQLNISGNQDKNTKIINTNGLWTGARIGVYISGGENETPYNGHGKRGQPFGTFKNNADQSYLYGFVNDRNGLKGGIIANQGANDKKIYWVEIFSLAIQKQVNSYKDDTAEEFAFKVTLSGTSANGEYAESINTPDNDLEKYGGLYFKNGIAEYKVVKDGSEIKKVPLKLKSGETVTAERLPAGLNYKIEEKLSDDQKAAFSPMPYQIVYGSVGENSEKTDGTRYMSTVKFTNLRPVCKITTNSGNQLYYKYDKDVDNISLEYKWYEQVSGQYKYVTKYYYTSYDSRPAQDYAPAVYSTLEEAISVINNNRTLYFKNGSTYYAYSGTDHNIDMIADAYTMASAAADTANRTIGTGKIVTLKTAGKSDALFPYQGVDGISAVVSRGAFDADSMLIAAGDLTITNITLDGEKSSKTSVTAYGGILNVPAGGKLKVLSGATLKNSKTSGNGGAVYVASLGEMTIKDAIGVFTGGVINYNAVTGTGQGAGVYLEEGAKLYISGSPNFGGTGLKPNGSVDPERGNIMMEGEVAYRQDIYIAGYQNADEEDCTADSLVVNGNIGSGDATIWVWAEKSPRYLAQKQFAKYDAINVTDPENSMAAFRNAQKDTLTGADSLGTYIFGTINSGDTENVFWSHSRGSAHVILVKVNEVGGSETYYKALSGRTFKVCTSSGATAKGTVLKDDGTEDTNFALEGLVSGAGGAFFIGDLPYGKYYAEEGSNRFDFAVTEDGVITIGDYDSHTTNPDPYKEVTHN